MPRATRTAVSPFDRRGVVERSRHVPGPALHIVVAVGLLQPVALRFEPLHAGPQLGDFVVDRFGLLSHFQHPLVAVELENLS